MTTARKFIALLGLPAGVYALAVRPRMLRWALRRGGAGGPLGSVERGSLPLGYWWNLVFPPRMPFGACARHDRSKGDHNLPI